MNKNNKTDSNILYSWIFPEIFLRVRAIFLLFKSSEVSKSRSLFARIRRFLSLLDRRDRRCMTRILRTCIRRRARWILLQPQPNSSFRFLISSSTRASMFLLRTESLLSVYLRMELQRLCRYVLMRRENQRAVEARLKYLILGSFRSGLFLLGIGMIYRREGTLVFWPKEELSLGLRLMARALFFKAGRRPFHFWVADVYQGAPTLSRAFLRSVRKRGILGLRMTLPIPSYRLWVVARSSMLIGVLGAIPQSHLKRLFRYSSIAQVGYVLLGLLGAGKRRVVIFVRIYLRTVLHRFGIFLSHTTFSQLQRSFSISFQTQVALTFFSLTGIPPLAGFLAKARVFQSARERGEFGRMVFRVIASILGAVYRLRIIQNLFFQMNSMPSQKRLSSKEIPRTRRRLLSTTSLLLTRGLFFLFTFSSLFLQKKR